MLTHLPKMSIIRGLHLFHQSLRIFPRDFLVKSSWSLDVDCLHWGCISHDLFLPYTFPSQVLISEFLNCSQPPHTSYEDILCWFNLVWLMPSCIFSEEEILFLLIMLLKIEVIIHFTWNHMTCHYNIKHKHTYPILPSGQQGFLQ